MQHSSPDEHEGSNLHFALGPQIPGDGPALLVIDHTYNMRLSSFARMREKICVFQAEVLLSDTIAWMKIWCLHCAINDQNVLLGKMMCPESF